jgi:hypothetical protein
MDDVEHEFRCLRQRDETGVGGPADDGGPEADFADGFWLLPSQLEQLTRSRE